MKKLQSDALLNFARSTRNRIPRKPYCLLANTVYAALGNRHRISPLPGEPVFRADDGETRIHFCRLRRSYRFKRGVMRRVRDLAHEYHLEVIDLSNGGLFVDSGANIGELGLWARAHELDYIAFEPEPLEARCCDLNNFGGQPGTRREALWNEETTLSFYSKPESADSSIIDMPGSVSRTEVPAVTLDGALDLSGVEGTVIFKVEAEGAEPEVLEGATKSLARIDWVALDCGYERGQQQAHTFIETNVFLYDHGFVPRHADIRRNRILYQNTRR